VVPESVQETDSAVADEFLTIITAGWSDLRENAILEVRCLFPGKVPQIGRFAGDESGIAEAVAYAAAYNAQGYNVYPVINPVRASSPLRRDGKLTGAFDTDIICSFFFWADGDDEAAAYAIQNFAGPKYTFAVTTGKTPFPRPHIYWRVEDGPIHNLETWSQIQRGIAAQLSTDKTVVNPSRIMRLPGMINWPTDAKRAKGRVPELSTLNTTYSDDRAPVEAERMWRIFGASGAAAAHSSADGFKIDTGAAHRVQTEYADILRRAQTDGEKHGGVRDLAASLAGQGIKRELAEAIIANACPVWDEGVVRLIDTAYVKFKPADAPQPIEATPQTIQDFPIDDSAAFLADLQPLEYLIDGLLPMGVTYSLTGHAGHGKTTLALQFALSVATGDLFGERETSKGRVLILAGENPYNVKWQYAAALAARGIPPADVDIHFVQGRFSINEWSDVLRSKMEAMPDLKLVIVDSLQAFFEGDNDNDNSQMVEMAHKLRNLCATTRRPSILIIAHPAGKTPSKDNLVPRGGGAFLNEIDGNLTVWSQDASQQTLHHSQKFRGAGFDPMEWVMQVHEFSHLHDINGVPLKLPVSRPEMTTERRAREMTTDTILRQYLDTVEAGKPLSVREGAERFRVSRWKMEQIVKTAKDEKLIRRHAKTYVLTDGGKDFLEAENAGV